MVNKYIKNEISKNNEKQNKERKRNRINRCNNRNSNCFGSWGGEGKAGGDQGNLGLYFDASRSTSIYGKSDIISNEDRMTAMSLAYNKWLEYAAKDYDKISSEAKRTTTNDRFDIESTVLPETALDGGGTAKPVAISVYKAGTDKIAYAMTAEKVHPSLDEYYNKTDVEEKLKELEDKLSHSGTVGYPDYNNAYVLKSWNAGTSTVIIPDDGWIYIWDGNRTEDIAGRQSGAGYPNVTGIILKSNIKQSCGYYTCTPSYGQNIITTTVATTFDGYASSIIPVSKGTTITVDSIEDFIPTKK